MKNDTIGFFGPVGWARIDDGAGIRVDPADPTGARRPSGTATWRAGRCARCMAEHALRLRPWLVPRRMPFVERGRDDAAGAAGAAGAADRAEAAVMRACDGVRDAQRGRRGGAGRPAGRDCGRRGRVRGDGPAGRRPPDGLAGGRGAAGHPAGADGAGACWPGSPTKACAARARGPGRAGAARDELAAAAGDAERLTGRDGRPGGHVHPPGRRPADPAGRRDVRRAHPRLRGVPARPAPSAVGEATPRRHPRGAGPGAGQRAVVHRGLRDGVRAALRGDLPAAGGRAGHRRGAVGRLLAAGRRGAVPPAAAADRAADRRAAPALGRRADPAGRRAAGPVHGGGAGAGGGRRLPCRGGPAGRPRGSTART